MKNKKFILLIWIALTAFGILAIYSVSIYESFQITLKMVAKWHMNNASNYYYFFKQLISLVVWVIIATGVYFLPIKKIQEHKNKIFFWAVILQLLVFTPLGIELNWSRWWLYISWLGTLQPAEIFKLAFVMFLAWWLVKKKDLLDNFKGFIMFGFVIWIFFLIFLKIPDLWTLLVLWPVALVMYWYGWWNIKYIITTMILWIVFWLTIWMQFHYIRERIEYFINPNVDESWRWISWQITQSLISIWWGGTFGKWYGKWLQKFGYIPEAQSDFVFAAFSEEIWFFWDMILILLYFFLGFTFLKNSEEVKNPYYKNLGIWIISLILLQAIVNMWVNVKLLPLTWLTLPFVSYWWTALMINFVELILLYKIVIWKD